LQPGAETLAAINTVFRDWIWWLITKAAAGRDGLVAHHLPQLDERCVGASEQVNLFLRAVVEGRLP